MGQAQLQSAEACLSIGHTAASDPHPASCEGPRRTSLARRVRHSTVAERLDVDPARLHETAAR